MTDSCSRSIVGLQKGFLKGRWKADMIDWVKRFNSGRGLSKGEQNRKESGGGCRDSDPKNIWGSLDGGRPGPGGSLDTLETPINSK